MIGRKPASVKSFAVVHEAKPMKDSAFCEHAHYPTSSQGQNGVASYPQKKKKKRHSPKGKQENTASGQGIFFNWGWGTVQEKSEQEP
jgi:hypothetical protein